MDSRAHKSSLFTTNSSTEFLFLFRQQEQGGWFLWISLAWHVYWQLTFSLNSSVSKPRAGALHLSPIEHEQSMLYMLLLSNPLNWRWSPINHTEQSQGQHFSRDPTAEWKADASLFFANRLQSSGGCQCRALIKSVSLHSWSFVGGAADNLGHLYLPF